MSQQPSKTHLFLFDIDGTLISSGGAGERSMQLAVKDVFGVEDDLHDVEIAGRTDHLITRNILKKYNVRWTPERAKDFLDRYLQHLAIELHLKKGRVLPGIVELLDALKARPHVAMGLLTGNLVRGAEIKLTHYGVWNYFEFGAYADDHFDRNQLGPFATVRAREKHGVEFLPERIFVIGDTPHDIACGRIIGATTVAIATGGFTREQLAGHQPTFLFDDLSDVSNVLATLGV